MKVLITGGCGFVGTNLALFLKTKNFNVNCLDNLSRKGSRYNLNLLRNKKIRNYKFDIHNFKRIQKLPKYDLIIDCCAEAAVEVSKKDIDSVINTNFLGTLNILKKAKKDKSKIIFLSTSRVYPIKNMNKIIKKKIISSKIKIKKTFGENDNLQGPKTIYGLTKLSSEMLIEEFAYAFNLKFLINRCGVISGPLQFGKQDQGFVSLWIWGHLKKKKMKYIGYGGLGYQVREVLHIDDLCEIILKQIKNFNKIKNITFNIGGGKKNSISLKNLTLKCRKITGNEIKINRVSKTSQFDIPYYVTDNKKVEKYYSWRPKKNVDQIVKDIYQWLVKNKKVKKYFK